MAVLPVARSPMINSRWPLPMGTMASTVLMPAKQNFLAQAETARQGEGDKEPAVESPEIEAEISKAFKKPPYINSDNENTARTKTPEELNFGKENVAADLNATGSLISEIKQKKTAGLVSQKTFEFLLKEIEKAIEERKINDS